MNDLLYILCYLVLSLISLGFTKLIEWLSTKNIDNSLKLAKDIIRSVIENISQTYVDDLKKQGRFDEKAKNFALMKAKEVVKKLLQTKICKDIKKVSCDYDMWISNEIESSINQMKKEKKENE